MSKQFLDNPEKTEIYPNDIIPGTDVQTGRDIRVKFATILTYILANLPDTITEGAGAAFSDTAPENPFNGQVWFDSSNGNKIMRWNGEAWEDVQRVLSLSDFGTGIKPVVIVNTLPNTGQSQGDVVFLTSDNKLYSWNGNEWNSKVETTDLLGTIVSNQIANAAITTAKFAAGIAPVEIVATLPNTGNFEGRTVYLTTDDKLYRWTGAAWTATVAAADVTGTLTDSQLAAIAAAKITGTITETQISDGAISTPKLAAGAVTANEIAANTITAAQIAAATITATQIAAAAITTAKIAAGAITATELAADSVTAGKIAAAAISATEIATGAITSDKVAADAITASKIAANSIQATHLATGAITTDKLDANAVTAGKIAAGAITATTVGTNQIIATAANIADAAITSAKIASLDAGKINAGDMATVNLSVAGRLYNAAYPANKFHAIELATGFNASFNWGSGTGFTFNHDTGVRFYGPSSGSTPIMNPNGGMMTFVIFAEIISYTGIMCVYYRKNGSGSYIPCATLNSDDGGSARFAGRRQLTGLALTDHLDFYVAPCDGNGDPTASGITKQWALDIMAINW